MTESVRNDPHWLIVGLENVVTTSVPAARIDALAEAARLDPVDVHTRLWGSGFVSRCCLGQLGLAEMITGVRQHLAADLTEAHLMGLWSLAYEPDLDAIAELAASGYQVGAVADETPLFRASFEPYLPEVELLTDCAWFSYEHDALTNDEAFYRSVTQGPELRSAKPTFVPATPDQGQAAAAAGWRVAPDLRSAFEGGER